MAKQTKEQKEAGDASAKETNKSTQPAAETTSPTQQPDPNSTEPFVQPDQGLITGASPDAVQANQTETFIEQNPEVQPEPNPQDQEPPAVDQPSAEQPPVQDPEPAVKESRNSVAIILENAVTPQVIGEQEFVVGLDRRLSIGKKIKADDDSHEFNVVYVGPGRFKEDDPGTAVFDHMIQQTKYKKDLKKDKVLQVGTKFRIVD